MKLLQALIDWLTGDDDDTTEYDHRRAIADTYIASVNCKTTIEDEEAYPLLLNLVRRNFKVSEDQAVKILEEFASDTRRSILNSWRWHLRGWSSGDRIYYLNEQGQLEWEWNN